MTYNAASRKDVRRLEKQARIDEVERIDTVRTLMATTGGRRWVHDLLVRCHVFASSFSLDAKEMAFREGERHVGLHVLADAQQFSENYMLMMREANVRHSTADARERSDSEDGDGGDQEPDSFADSPDAA